MILRDRLKIHFERAGIGVCQPNFNVKISMKRPLYPPVQPRIGNIQTVSHQSIG